MNKRYAPDELLDFPCYYEFKVFAAVTGDDAFVEAVGTAVSGVVPVDRELLRTRLSSGGRYQCVTVGVRLESSSQLTAIYANLRGIDEMRYLL